MGNWNINIQGIGAHHNQNNPGDANKIFQKFVNELKANGHSVQHASFTHGGAEFPMKVIEGQEVIYKGYDGIEFPATVDKVWSDICINLAYNNGLMATSVLYNRDGTNGTWRLKTDIVYGCCSEQK